MGTSRRQKRLSEESTPAHILFVFNNVCDSKRFSDEDILSILNEVSTQHILLLVKSTVLQYFTLYVKWQPNTVPKLYLFLYNATCPYWHQPNLAASTSDRSVCIKNRILYTAIEINNKRYRNCFLLLFLGSLFILLS